MHKCWVKRNRFPSRFPSTVSLWVLEHLKTNDVYKWTFTASSVVCTQMNDFLFSDSALLIYRFKAKLPHCTSSKCSSAVFLMCMFSVMWPVSLITPLCVDIIIKKLHPICKNSGHITFTDLYCYKSKYKPKFNWDFALSTIPNTLHQKHTWHSTEGLLWL